MLTLRFVRRSLTAGSVLLGAAALMAGCSGSQSNPMPQAASQAPFQAQTGWGTDAKCVHSGNVKVKPCAVDFTTSNPGPQTVTVKAPKKDTVSEGDNCNGPTGIAEVAQGQGSTWVVTAGAMTGSCTATFTSKNKKGKVTGTAELAITNSV